MSPRTATQGTADLLRALPLFSRIGPEAAAVVAFRTRARRLLRGEVVFHRGDPSAGFFVVVSGLVKLAVEGADGDEKVVEVIQAGQTFGEAVMLLGEPYPVTATALEASRVLAVPLDAVEQLLVTDPMFARRMLAGMALRLHTMVGDVASTALRSGRERVIAYLVACAASPGQPGQPGPQGPQGPPEQGSAPGPSVVVLSTSKQVVASRLNLSPETFSRVLRELSELGLIVVEGRRITIPDLAALAR